MIKIVSVFQRIKPTFREGYNRIICNENFILRIKKCNYGFFHTKIVN